ncbi:putative metal-binding motif-containing protein [Myxococcus sp. K15C18031901]|uniref:putative metal-binding motif-containing protein n=1 Tax=Myxococcus dinghuensis TaxID=2906761 RepID=UPI0020A78F19|nr:putative metal-binding motif-containing protein [Myxococcus dinghuensis]MCP3102457.1 putative metal-binding motif-containing protein [Myxococcus dinghuensis]
MKRAGRLWLVGALLLAGCSVPGLEELLAGREVKVSIEYTPSFKKGCLRVVAEDERNASLKVEQTISDLAKQTSPVKVSLLRGPEWAGDVRLTVSAHESSCAGLAVDTESVVLAPQALKVEQVVRLTAPDADGDGYVPLASGGTDCDDTPVTGALRFPGNAEVCDSIDNDCDNLADEGLPVEELFVDQDGDGYGVGSPILGCKPAMGYATRGGDCDDADAARHPGATELCDEKDNNCDGNADETFPTKGQACARSCGGVVVCGADHSSVVCSKADPVFYFPDADGDGQGSVDGKAVEVCEGVTPPSKSVSNQQDCDDADPKVRVGAVEVCDAIDNNCSGTVDEGLSCGGTLKVVADVALGGTGHDWRTVAVGVSGYPVWVAGLEGKLAVRKAAGQAFTDFSYYGGSSPAGNCGPYDWHASWVDSAGNVYLSGGNGYVVKHNGTSCSAPNSVTGNAEVRGMVGFENGTTVTIYLVDVEGRLHSWVPGSSPIQRNDNSSRYYGIHGIDANRLMVASGSGGTENPRLWSYWNSDWANPVAQQILPAPANGYVSAVWMGSNTTATAVGTGGRAWMWDGNSTWNQAPVSPAGTVDFSSVVMLPNGDSYLVEKSANAQLQRLTPYGWAKEPKLPAPTGSVPAKPLFDIAMAGSGDFWLVGDDGRVWHYPEP